MLANTVFNPFCQSKDSCCIEYDFNGPSSNPLIDAIDQALEKSPSLFETEQL